MTDELELQRLASSISDALADRPEFLGAALEAISRGMNRALQKQKARAGASDQATLAAMCLAKGRIPAELRETLMARVVAAIHPSNQSAAEREYTNAYDAMLKERKP